MVGGVKIGGGAPISVQSMTNTDTRDTKKTISQIRELESAGCDIVRVAVPDKEAVAALPVIKKSIKIPLVADIHFNYRLAIGAVAQGADGIRINPGNIGGEKRIKEIVRVCREGSIPIRIGVNAGSLERRLLQKYRGPTAQAMVESALNSIKLLEDMDFTSIKVSLKASDIPTTVEAYRLFSRQSTYPLHLGLTATGTTFSGSIKSATVLGILLNEGIGDTIRVSLSGPPRDEVLAGYEILRSLGLRHRGPELICCPTCGRMEINVIQIARKIEKALASSSSPLKIAIMGCIVNGPGEAALVDLGIVGVRGGALLYRHGKKIGRYEKEKALRMLLEECKKFNHQL